MVNDYVTTVWEAKPLAQSCSINRSPLLLEHHRHFGFAPVLSSESGLPNPSLQPCEPASDLP